MSPERLVPQESVGIDLIDRHMERYRFAATMVGGHSVLDVACGSGYGSAHLADAGARSVVGVDIAEEAIQHAESMYQRPHLRFKRLNAEEIHTLGLFDRIVSFETIEHLANPEAFLAATVRALHPEGILLISTPRRMAGSLDDTPQNPFHVREWNEAEFRALLEDFYQSVDFRYQGAFEALPFPGSRTLQSWAARLIHRPAFRQAGSYQVVDRCPTFAGLRFSVAYFVAICRLPKTRRDAA